MNFGEIKEMINEYSIYTDGRRSPKASLYLGLAKHDIDYFLKISYTNIGFLSYVDEDSKLVFVAAHCLPNHSVCKDRHQDYKCFSIDYQPYCCRIINLSDNKAVYQTYADHLFTKYTNQSFADDPSIIAFISESLYKCEKMVSEAELAMITLE